MDLDQRIAQFENMAAEDADNDMAHFSLGGAYLQAGRHAEAAASLQRCLKLNPEMSKAYQLAGEALIGSGQEDAAAELLLKGYEIASGKGDVMPRDAMAELLKKLGRELPTTVIEPAPASTAAADGDGFICKASGRPGTQLPESPMRGALGQWIYENISAEMWKTWIGQGTKVINELRLDFSREEDQKVYDQYMCEFLG
ncbi:MAG: Fe(2+)-trafficking protein, partial [Planctomycetes bacterium]|nr:Fe(2+)-trafficking protein [Planctomycetota bacterium]